MEKSKFLIDGKWMNGRDTFLNINPSTEKVICSICQCNKNEVDLAVRAAKAAFPSWSNYPIKKRIEILHNVNEIFNKYYGSQGEPSDLKRLITHEVGKRFLESDIEVLESIDIIAYFIKNSEKLLKERRININKKQWPYKESILRFEPIGVIGIIKAWNYPLELPLWSIIPAIISGNTVVFKPSENASLVGLEIGKIFEKAGLPKGVLNIITGNYITGNHLVEHSEVNMISFTGSVNVGKKIAKKCSERLMKYNLELGGNDAAIVELDADIELVANGLVWGAFCNSGQVCVRPKRVFVHKDIINVVTNKIVEKTNKLRVDIDYGPVINRKQLNKIINQVNDAIQKGAIILSGGKKIPNKKGFYFYPTILKNLNNTMNILNEECFGPVLPIISYNNTEEAVILANTSKYGLGASVWTQNRSKGEKIANSLQTGMVWVNDINVAYPEAPWCSIKQSGTGIELSEWGLYEYVHKKHISIEFSENKRRDWWYPYPEISM